MSDLKKKIEEDLEASRKRLEYSYNKARMIPLDASQSEEDLEILESFSSRFARHSDLIVSKYLRLLAREKDPAFRGAAIDVINMGEKFGWIEDAAVWRRMRELRNVAAHEYEAEDYQSLYKELLRLTPHLLRFAAAGQRYPQGPAGRSASGLDRPAA